MKSKIKLLILGGTGAMGTHLVELISEYGGGNFDVTVTSRTVHQERENLHYIQGNAKEDSFLQSLLQYRWDVIVDFMSYSTAQFSKRYEAILSSTDQYIFLSSARVYAQSDKPLTEGSPRLLDVCHDADYLITDEYALAKARQEDLLRNSGKNNWTIIRPYITYSEYRLQLSCLEKESWLYRALHGRTIVISNDLLSRKTTFTYGKDVAAGIVSVIGNCESLGKSYHITNNETHTWEEILSIYLTAIEKKTGKRPEIMTIDSYKWYMGGNPLQVKYDRLYDRVFDNSQIKKFSNTKIYHPVESTLIACVNSFIEAPRWLDINWGHEAAKDRLTGEHISFREWFNIKRNRSKLQYLLIRYGLYRPKW